VAIRIATPNAPRVGRTSAPQRQIRDCQLRRRWWLRRSGRLRIGLVRRAS
jgi:hypothetical protein